MPTAGKAKHRNKTYLYLSLIVALAVILRLYFFVGPNMNDDMEYVFSSYQVSNDDFSPLWSDSIDSIRSMMILPISVFFFLVGPSEFSASMWPLIASLLTVIVTFFIGRLLFGNKVGLLASFLLAIFPLDVVWSTQLVPSIPMTLFLTTSIFLFLLAEKRQRRLYFLLSGIFVGFSYLASELFFVAGFFFIAYLIWKRKFRQEYVLMIIGFLVVFSAESFFMFFKTGNFFHRIDVIHAEELRVLTNTDLMYYPRVLFNFINPNFDAHEGNLGIFVYLFIAASLFAFNRKRWDAIFFVVFVLISLIYLEFGVMTSTFKPIAKWVRYLVIFGPIFSLLIAYLFAGISRKKLVLAALIIFAFITSLPYILESSRAYNSWISDFREEYNYLKTLPDKPIFTDSGGHGYLTLYFKFKKTLSLLENSKIQDINDSYVIINGSLGIVTYQIMREQLPEFAKNPPSNWKLLKVIEGNYDFYNPKIYYVR